MDLASVQDYLTICGIVTKIIDHEGEPSVVHRLKGYKNGYLPKEAMESIAHFIEVMKDVDASIFMVEDFVVVQNKHL